jgi:hypothetical protein
MSEDLAFKIQLGVILPKMKEKLTSDVGVIVEEMVNIVKAGTREGEEFSMDPVKEMIMKDFDIFLTDCILPDIEKKMSPELDEVSGEEEVSEETQEEPEA